MRIFQNKRDYQRFLKTLFYYQLEGPKPKFSKFKPNENSLDSERKIVEIICYCLMPNHFHFLIQQKTNGGLTEFISKLSNSYTKYINTKNQRFGPLFQGEFKAVHIESNEQLIHLSRYIHLNPLVNYVCKNLDDYQWSSYFEYSGKSKDRHCSKSIILDQFKNIPEYLQFIKDQEDYGKSLEQIKHQTLDFPQVSG